MYDERLSSSIESLFHQHLKSSKADSRIRSLDVPHLFEGTSGLISSERFQRDFVSPLIRAYRLIAVADPSSPLDVLKVVIKEGKTANLTMKARDLKEIFLIHANASDDLSCTLAIVDEWMREDILPLEQGRKILAMLSMLLNESTDSVITSGDIVTNEESRLFDSLSVIESGLIQLTKGVNRPVELGDESMRSLEQLEGILEHLLNEILVTERRLQNLEAISE